VEPYDAKLREAKMAKKAPATAFTNCYVKNFPPGVGEEQLRAVLERHGRVSSLYLPLKEDGTPVGYACANFETPEEAADAIGSLHGRGGVFGRGVGEEDGAAPPAFYIQKAENKKDRAETIQRQMEMLSFDGQRSKCNLYVSNIPDTFSKEEIKSIFEKFGTITAFKIASAGPNSSKQYGYICYASADEAAVAFEKIDGTFLDGNKLQISYYKNKAERTMEGGAVAGSAGALDAKATAFLEPLGIKLDAPRRRVMEALYGSILARAPSYCEYWADLGVQDEADFAQRLVISMVDLPINRMKDMLHRAEFVDEFIQKSIEKKSAFQRQARITN